MRKYIIGMVIGMLLSSAVIALAGNLDPPNPPDSTFSYTLEDIYNRLNTGAAGSQSTWAEPAAGPGATGYTLNEVMALAPSLDNTNGATTTQVLTGKTYWGLRSSTWALQTGTMPDNGTVTLTPTTTQQTIVMGYHDGSGYVVGDADLISGNIKSGVNLFGVAGALTGGSTYNAGVPKTGQIISYTVGDDGDLEMGVAWPVPRFTDNGDGTVMDNMTGLIWLKEASCFGREDWTTALSDAANLNSGECALTDGSIEGDWRLPNLRELHSLVHYGLINPAVPNTAGTGQWEMGDPFFGVQLSNYWSSTTSVVNSSDAWVVFMTWGLLVEDQKSGMNFVWPVRGGQ